MCTCSNVFTWRWVWVHEGAQREPHASLFLWDRVSYWPRSPQARWQDVQWAQGRLLPPFPERWYYSYSLPCPDFLYGFWGPTSSPHASNKYFSDWAVPPSPRVLLERSRIYSWRCCPSWLSHLSVVPHSQHCHDEGWVSPWFVRGHPYLTQDKLRKWINAQFRAKTVVRLLELQCLFT